MGLPGALDAALAPPPAGEDAVPAALAAKCTTVQNEGGVAALYDAQERVKEGREEARQLLDAAVDLLDGEEARDGECRKRWGGAWRRTPSHSPTGAPLPVSSTRAR